MMTFNIFRSVAACALLAAGFAFAPGAVAQTTASTSAPIVVQERPSRAVWLKAEVVHADLHSIIVRERDNALLIHTFTYSQKAQDKMNMIVDNGDGATKIWMTGLGAPTSAPSAAGVSQHELARQITDVLWKAAESGFSGPAFIFSIRDVNSAHQDDEQDNFGALLTSDWQPKLAASVLAR